MRFPCSPFPGLVGPGLILPRAFHPLQRSRSIACSLSFPSSGLSTITRKASERLPWVFPLFTTSTDGSTDIGFPLPHQGSFPGHPGWNLPFRAFRPRRFARPRRLAPLSVLRACFIPLPRTGLLLQGFIPRSGSVPGFPGRSPLLPLNIRACGMTRSNSNVLDFRGFLPKSSAVTCVMGEITLAPRPSWNSPPSGLPIPSPDIPSRVCLRLRSSPR